jgi:RNA polymerase sigma-70 factor (ECF subfamily)
MNDRRRRFEAQVLPHLDAAHNLARWLARSPADADDIVQEAILRAYRSFDGFRGGDTNQDTALVETSPDPELAAIRADQSRKLDQIVAALPQEFREVLVLREMEDLSYRDIAQVTGAPIGTVMSRLARARTLLKEKWLRDVEGVRHGMP